MTLYSIPYEMEACIDPETGEVIDMEKLQALEMEFEAKALNIACWIKNLKAEAEAIKTEKQNLEKRQKAAENKAESLKKYLSDNLNGMKLKDSRVAISYRRSESVEVDDMLDLRTLPDDLVKVRLEPDKTAIKEAIKEGMVVKGCRIVEKNNLQIR